MEMPDPNRREFLHASGMAFGGALLALQLPAIRAAARWASEAAARGASFEHLTAAQAAGLEAVASQIFPSDDRSGATEAGVLHFLDRALGSFASGDRSAIESGLADLDRRAQSREPAAADFAGLSFEVQTEVLREVESESFFGIARGLVVMGMFALPSWGGNRDRVGWELLGFEDRFVWRPPFGYYDAAAGEADGGGAGGPDMGDR